MDHFDDDDVVISPGLERFVVLGVVATIILLAFTPQRYLRVPETTDEAIAFNALLIILAYNYLCVLLAGDKTHFVPNHYHPRNEQICHYCSRCKAYKPPRSHHCSTCRRCVRRMDHHCIFAARCISHATLPHFIRFLLTVDLAVCWQIKMIWYWVTVTAEQMRRDPTTWEMSVAVVNITLSLLVLAFVGILTIMHVRLMCHGTSTIEALELDKVDTWQRQGKIEKVQYPFNKGVYRNVCEVLGPYWWLWLWPGQAAFGDGLEWHVKEKSLLPWPPKDPSEREYNTRGSDRINGQSQFKHFESQVETTSVNDNTSDPDSDDNPLFVKVRRGSEGWEFKPRRQVLSTAENP